MASVKSRMADHYELLHIRFTGPMDLFLRQFNVYDPFYKPLLTRHFDTTTSDHCNSSGKSVSKFHVLHIRQGQLYLCNLRHDEVVPVAVLVGHLVTFSFSGLVPITATLLWCVNLLQCQGFKTEVHINFRWTPDRWLLITKKNCVFLLLPVC